MSSSPSQSAAMTAAAGAAGAAVSPSHTKICFNVHCKEQIAEGSSPRRRGWRLRSGELAELCARCAAVYEQGSFCETFHSDGDGWRKCESCGKRVHCGCIVSASALMLLDAGGIECIACARKNFITAPPNHVSQSSLIFTLGPERLKDSSAKNWAHLNASSPVPGQWRQASNMWKTFTQSDLQQRLSYEFDRPNGVDRLISGQRLPIPPHGKKKVEDLPINVNSPYASVPVFNDLHREERCVVGLHDSAHLVEETDVVTRRELAMANAYGGSAGISFGPLSNPNLNTSLPSIVKDETPVHLVSLVSSPPSDSNSARRIASTHSHVAKQGFHNAAPSVADSSGEAQAQVKTVRSRVEGRCRNQLLPRYWPRITDQELQQISGDSNSVVTPLFEKMLSASDAGRIGRLVLPKKCAEAYFPVISQPEGLPLKVQDANGQEWVFQFRFWPNNNSRMYVLEGVTPCIQSMKLQAGDTVTFSRMDPEGKLVMGFRKASNVSNDQDIQAGKEASQRNGSRSGEGIPAVHSRASKGSKSSSKGFINNGDKSATKPYVLLPASAKRKGVAPVSKNKRLRIENEDSIELKLTWEEAQELLHPPPNLKPSIVVIDGHEFEEYEEAPVLGKPAAFALNEAGYSSPPAREAASPLPPDSLPPNNAAPSSSAATAAAAAAARKNKGKGESEAAALEAAAEGLDALANLAILGEEPLPSSSSPSSSHQYHDPLHHSHHDHPLHHPHLHHDPHQPQAAPPTTRHPRHRPGCTCIVCIQPPSGKGPKHKPSCQCNVCLTVKRRFRTLMLRKEKRQSEKDGAPDRPPPPAAMVVELPPLPPRDGPAAPDAAPPAPPEEEARKPAPPLPSPIKTPQIDLNIQPDREEEPSPVSDAGNLMRLLQDAAA